MFYKKSKKNKPIRKMSTWESWTIILASQWLFCRGLLRFRVQKSGNNRRGHARKHRSGHMRIRGWGYGWLRRRGFTKSWRRSPDKRWWLPLDRRGRGHLSLQGSAIMMSSSSRVSPSSYLQVSSSKIGNIPIYSLAICLWSIQVGTAGSLVQIVGFALIAV